MLIKLGILIKLFLNSRIKQNIDFIITNNNINAIGKSLFISSPKDIKFFLNKNYYVLIFFRF